MKPIKKKKWCKPKAMEEKIIDRRLVTTACAHSTSTLGSGTCCSCTPGGTNS